MSMEVRKDDVDLNVEWRKACDEFFKITDMRLEQKAQPDNIAAMIRANKAKDEKESARLRKFQAVISKTVTCIQSVGGALAQVASMFFGPSEICINAISFFVEAAMSYKKIFTDLDELWALISDALERFAIYKDNQGLLDAGMKGVASQILLQFIGVCRLSCKILHKNRVWQVAKTTLFKDNAGVPDAINDLVKTIDRETRTRGTYSYVSIKATEKNVVEGFSQMQQGFGQTASDLNQANEGITEIKGIVAQNDRDRQLKEVFEKLGKPDITQRDYCGTYTRSAIPGAGTWIFEQESFQRWLAGDREQPQVVFLSGEESCGKSFLLSTVMQNLIQRHPYGREDLSRTSVVCYYFGKADVSSKDSKDMAKLPSRDQNCSVHAALRALAYQIAENDPLYRKALQRLPQDFVISTNDTIELWRLLFGLQNGGAQVYLLLDGVHELEDQYLIELRQLLDMVAAQSSQDLRIRVMISGRTGNVKVLSDKLGTSASTIDMAANNSADIRAFVRKEVENMPLLKRSDVLRDEICTALGEIAKGAFGNIRLLLQQIRIRQRPSEIKKLLEEAKRSDNILDTIERQIEHCNETLTDADIEDLNQLLEWAMCAPWSHTLKEFEAILQIRKGSSSDSSLKPVYERIKNEFSGFFSVKPDSNDPESDVTLVSDKVKEHFERLSTNELDDSKMSNTKVTQMEVDIIQRFLKNLCDDTLYKKFEFEEFFKRKVGSASKVHVNTEEMHAKVALDCIKDMSTEIVPQSERDLDWVAGYQLPVSLESADLSYLGPRLKGEIGKRLAALFFEDGLPEPWGYYSLAEWIVEDKLEAAVLKWFRDTAATKTIPEDQKVWISSLKSGADVEHDLLEYVAETAAKAWLFGKPKEKATDSIEEPFRICRAYQNRIQNKKSSAVKRFDYRDYWDEETNEDLTDLIEWAKKSAGLVKLTYVSSGHIAESYRLLKNYSRAEDILHQAIEMNEGEAIEAQRSLATIYERTNRFELAIKTLSQVIQNLESFVTLSKEQANDLKADRKSVAKWKKSLSLYEEAMGMYKGMLEEEAEDYEIVGEILFLLADRDDSKQILDLLDSLRTEVDSRTGNDRLTQLLLARADDPEVHDIISQSARALGFTDRIRSSYEKTIKIAAKDGVADPSDIEGEHRLRPLEAIVHLKHSLANSLHRYSDSAADVLQAIGIWEELTQLPVPPSTFDNLIRPLNQAACRVALHYIHKAQVAGHGSDAASTFIKRVEGISKGRADNLPRLMEYEEIDLMLGYYYASVGQEDKAREMLKSNIELGVALLSDEDDLNDHDGFIRLANSFVRLGDDQNALAAWSLIAPDKNLPAVGANSWESQLDNLTSPYESVSNGMETIDYIASDSSSEKENQSSDPASRPSLTRNQSSPTREKPKGPLEYQCECGTCNTQFTFADNFWVCKQCIDVFFTPQCLEKLRQNKLRRHVCDKSHEFFYVPPCDFERAREFGKFLVMAGDVAIPVKNWLEGIREEWGIKGGNKKETKEE